MSEFVQLLREATSNNSIKIPAGLALHGTSDSMRMHMSASAVIKNMQDDEAAFEAWCLALMTWCGVRKILFSWDEPEEQIDKGHYQRFLFRVTNFSFLFSDVFFVERDCSLAGAVFVDDKEKMIVNVAGNRTKKVIEGDDESERGIEISLYKSEFFKKRLGLEKLDRQFPVGLFSEKVLKVNRVFNGGKSAIDLIGVDGDKTLWIFELKTTKNLKIGIVSELMFYTAFVQCLRVGEFSFEKEISGKGVVVGPKDVLESRSIKACMLADKFHPLLEDGDGRILGALNAAYKKKEIPVEFVMERVTVSG